jgi:hypothetical protein
MVINCLVGEPLNSSFTLCSNIHTTAPTVMNDRTMTAHISGENGRRKAQAPEFNFLNGTTTTRPDEANGCVKSTIFVLLVVIVTSPTTASKIYKKSNFSYYAEN